ncbi:MAG: TetR family transcriptional regulator [Myxococcales bacterium]|nr:TetR family transcriptional regulator [Myxococcales bacterium]MCB9704200.1 TetR family transcriptional regulator [Myxococcales bacterium]
MSLALDDDEEGRRILAAAGRLVARRGHDFSMADLARSAGISRATLYRRVGRRGALLDALRRRGARTPASTRERILRAAVELVGERGPHGFALEDVAARADASVTTIYREVGGRDELLRTAMASQLPHQELRAHLADAEAPLRPALLGFVAAAIERLSSQPVLLRVLVGLDEAAWRALRAIRERESHLSLALTAFFQAQIRLGRVVDRPPELHASTLMGMILGAVFLDRHYAVGVGPSGAAAATIAERAEHVVSVFLDGAAAKTRRSRRSARGGREEEAR